MTMDPPKLRIQERSFEMHAETARPDRCVLFELIGRLDDLRRRVKHRFPRSGHDARNEAGRAIARIRRAGDSDGVALIAVEEILARAVGVNVDQARRDAAARRATGNPTDRRREARSQCDRLRSLDRPNVDVPSPTAMKAGPKQRLDIDTRANSVSARALRRGAAPSALPCRLRR